MSDSNMYLVLLVIYDFSFTRYSRSDKWIQSSKVNPIRHGVTYRNSTVLGVN